MNTPAKSAQLIPELERSDDNIGVHLSGPLVDVDVDGKGAEQWLIAALDHLLPDSPHIWGRPSRPRTHRAYTLGADDHFDPSAMPILGRIKRIDEVKVEIRGGHVSRGEYSLLPGSLHPDGEYYEWADTGKARATPAVTSVDALMRGIRKAGAIAVLAPHWQEGLRQDILMSLAGFLYRVQSISTAIAEDMFYMDQDEALEFVRTLMDLVDDDPKDRRARRLAFEQTWRKAERGIPVTGATRLAEITGDDSLVRKLYTLLGDDPNIAEIDEFSSRFVIWQGPALAIDLEQVARGGDRPFMTRQNFISSFAHRRVMLGDKWRTLPDLLWVMSTATRVQGVTFVPAGPRIVQDKVGDKVNLWSDWGIQPAEEPVTDEEIEPFLSYIRDVVANKDWKAAHWVLAWLADIFQNPSDKCGTALALVGKEGAGKSFLGHVIIGPIIGEGHYNTANSVDKVVRDFNAGYAYKLLIQCDEATNSRQRSSTARLKSVITDPWMQLEPKGVDSVKIPNHARLMFTSNEIEDALHLHSGNEDRRYTVLEVSDDKRSDLDYWEKLGEWLTESTLAKIHRYLLDYSYDQKLVRRPYVTSTKQRMQQSSWSAFDGWLAAMVSRGHPLADSVHRWPYQAFSDYDPHTIDRSQWPEWVSVTALLEDYRHHCRANNIRDALNYTEAHIRQEFGKLGFVQKDGSTRVRYDHYDDRTGTRTQMRPRVYRAPAREMIEGYLRDRHGYEVPSAPDEGDETAPPGHDDTDQEF